MSELESFKISKRAAIEQQKDVQLRLNALEARIQALVDKTLVKNNPLLTPILAMTHDKDELELLGRALPRVAELVNQYDTLQKQCDFLELLIDHPETIAALAGDFLDEFDQDITNLKE